MRLAKEITAVDAHACGEPGRVITGGVSEVPGKTMFEKMIYLKTHGDHLRKLMLREPRGYPAANCNVILPPTRGDADAGFVIMEQTEYPPMSGTNTICVVTVLLETGIVPVKGRIAKLKLDTPAGLVEVEAEMEAGRVTRVTFQNVPAFATHLDARIEVPNLGTVTVDVAYGGMFYVIADASALGFRLTPDEAHDIVRAGEMIKAAAQEQLPVAHPENPEIAGITIAQLSGPSVNSGVDRRNTVIVSTGKLDWKRPSSWVGALDRSPCGTGTCAKMAALHAKGLLPLGRDFVHEGILDTRFTGRLIAETRIGKYPAVVPAISGRAWITAFSRYVLDATDPFPEGFVVGDIWGNAS
ncbi:MAG TPA: proline racemase family protein [Candidatus Acidoferrales bacterium]|nr:proline racemase family protein [Candidatus Acidoferrales bacterium]